MTQVKKLVQKMVTRDTLSYRKMTDRPQVKDVTAEVEMKEGTETQEGKAEVDDKTLAQGTDRIHLGSLMSYPCTASFACLFGIAVAPLVPLSYP